MAAILKRGEISKKKLQACLHHQDSKILSTTNIRQIRNFWKVLILKQNIGRTKLVNEFTTWYLFGQFCVRFVRDQTKIATPIVSQGRVISYSLNAIFSVA